MFAVIAENDVSKWNDDTGVLYHFPKQYKKVLAPGTKVVYYKGALKDKAFESQRLAKEPHYFGTAEIGEHYPDLESSKGDLFCLIENYQPFDQAVIAKLRKGEYLEPIPENKKSNYWRNGARPITKDTYENIVSLASYADTFRYPQASPETKEIAEGQATTDIAHADE